MQTRNWANLNPNVPLTLFFWKWYFLCSQRHGNPIGIQLPISTLILKAFYKGFQMRYHFFLNSNENILGLNYQRLSCDISYDKNCRKILEHSNLHGLTLDFFKPSHLLSSQPSKKYVKMFFNPEIIFFDTWQFKIFDFEILRRGSSLGIGQFVTNPNCFQMLLCEATHEIS